ncbi:MAG: hypothetical protein ACJ73D_09285 [Pyrinomonadaceae bacterium]
MVKFVWLAVALMLVSLGNIGAQSTRTPPGRSKPATVLPAEYEIEAVVLKGQGVFIMHINPTADYQGTSQDAFVAFLGDHFGTKRPAGSVKRGEPKIVIKFGDDDDISTLKQAVETVRVSNRTVIELAPLVGSLRLIVSKPIADEGVRPNPLMLVATLDDKGNISLNRDDMGKLSDLSRLTAFLRNVYRDREKNGVFRENTNEIEKTVFIQMPPNGTGGDLVKIAKAIADAGSDRIGLQTEDLVERMEMLPDAPMAPKKKPGR